MAQGAMHHEGLEKSQIDRVIQSRKCESRSRSTRFALLFQEQIKIEGRIASRF